MVSATQAASASLNGLINLEKVAWPNSFPFDARCLELAIALVVLSRIDRTPCSCCASIPSLTLPSLVTMLSVADLAVCRVVCSQVLFFFHARHHQPRSTAATRGLAASELLSPSGGSSASSAGSSLAASGGAAGGGAGAGAGMAALPDPTGAAGTVFAATDLIRFAHAPTSLVTD